jgi:DNA mismatch repair protein MutS
MELFTDLVQSTIPFIPAIQKTAQAVAQLDVLNGFSLLAKTQAYCRPAINSGRVLSISQGRHPVIEKQLPSGEAYIPNDVYLNPDSQQFIMITGPNMSGKSAILRQTALIVLLAQMGSFVPATAAEIGLVDKIFTRVGASDNISMGESTFMVEMNETSAILNNITENSLILLDEIGRGTSTYDGISIAWAISVFLHQHSARPKTLFATHYHELNDMSERYERIKNYNVSFKELDDKVLFLRKLVPGGSAHSFGIHVAKMAGMPREVLAEAQNMLKRLEQNRGAKQVAKAVGDELQLSFFNLDDPILEDIRDQINNLDIDTLTPVEALMQLNEIKRLLQNKK